MGYTSYTIYILQASEDIFYRERDLFWQNMIDSSVQVGVFDSKLEDDCDEISD